MADAPTCEVCGETIPWTPGRGRRPRWCDDHKHKKNRARDFRARAAKGDAEAARKLAELGYAATPAGGSELERLAVFLGIYRGDARRAAEAAGVEARGAALSAMVARAKREHPRIMEGRQEAVHELGQQSMALLFLRLRDVAPILPAAQVAPALKQVTDVMHTLTGGGQMLPTEVTFEVAAPTSEERAEWLERTGADPSVLGETW